MIFALAVVVVSSPLFAQKFELNPYAGGILTSNSFSGESGYFAFKDQGLYGIRGSFFLTERFEVEGNFGYINHFELENRDPEARGLLWEASGVYRFDLETLKPFVTAGVGGITATVDEDSSGAVYSEGFLEGGDTFFNFSYEGGVKAPLLWGPFGLRADARGRTVPNFRGEAMTWFELTGGVTITFGN